MKYNKKTFTYFNKPYKIAKNHIRFVFTLLFFVFIYTSLSAQDLTSATQTPTISPVYMEKVIENGDTLFIAGYIREVYIYPPMVFTSKKQEQFYWRTVRDVKKALPYARLVSSEIARVNRDLYYMKGDAERKKYLKDFEKDAFKKYAFELKNLTINQGKMLVKLIDRECDANTYDLIKAYKGNVPAFMWNMVAHFFGSDLKAEYNGSDKDRIVERVINLVDSGQL